MKAVTYHSKAMANVKDFADKQTNGQAKNYMLPIYGCGGIKMVLKNYVYEGKHYRILNDTYSWYNE